MVMQLSRSRSLESMTRSTCSSWDPKMPLWLSMASTSVVLPWSTCAMMAMLRIEVLEDFIESKCFVGCYAARSLTRATHVGRFMPPYMIACYPELRYDTALTYGRAGLLFRTVLDRLGASCPPPQWRADPDPAQNRRPSDRASRARGRGRHQGRFDEIALAGHVRRGQQSREACVPAPQDAGRRRRRPRLHRDGSQTRVPVRRLRVAHASRFGQNLRIPGPFERTDRHRRKLFLRQAAHGDRRRVRHTAAGHSCGCAVEKACARSARMAVGSGTTVPARSQYRPVIGLRPDGRCGGAPAHH